MDDISKLAGYFELHDVSGIRKILADGISSYNTIGDQNILDMFISMYTRSPAFKDCVRALHEYGFQHEDPVLQATLENDPSALQELIRISPDVLHNKYFLRGAYTPLTGVSLLHICAEFDHLECAELLVSEGISVDIAAATDDKGLGGHTPLFHTVNQNGHHSKRMFDFLLENGADPKIGIVGFIWGEGFDWETFIPTVNPISYAMMGLLPQFHRDEKTIYRVVSVLMKKAYGINFQPSNIPNRYLK